MGVGLTLQNRSPDRTNPKWDVENSRCDVDPLFAWIESSELSRWVRGDCMCAFPTIVTLHNIGMAFLAGGGIAIDLRIIGFASGIPLKPMARFVPLMWLAFVVNAATGILMFIGYPTKALTNPLFYIKLTLVGVALWLFDRIATDILPAEGEQETLAAKAKVLAITSLAVWAVLMVAGRWLAYTYKWEMLGVPAVL